MAGEEFRGLNLLSVVQGVTYQVLSQFKALPDFASNSPAIFAGLLRIIVFPK